MSDLRILNGHVSRKDRTYEIDVEDDRRVTEAELWDLTDERGNLIGATHRRGAPDWPAGHFHVVAAVCVVRADGHVLLTKRAASKDHPLTWEFPAGSALAGERSVQAATRELKEETGLHAARGSLVLVGRFKESSALVDLFVARDLDTEDLSLQEEEVADATWVTLDEVARLRHTGAMAAPWEPRLDALWNELVELVD